MIPLAITVVVAVFTVVGLAYVRLNSPEVVEQRSVADKFSRLMTEDAVLTLYSLWDAKYPDVLIRPEVVREEAQKRLVYIKNL